jgi:hypothetical protein
MLYYDNDGERVPIGTTTWDFEGISEPMIEITVSVNADDVPDAIGKMIGVGFNNTTEDSSWAEVDNVRLTREAAAPVTEAIPLINPSFEQDSEGNTPCTEVTDFAQVPGWSTDDPVVDSGVSENANATDGACAAWLASFDPVLWQTADYAITSGEAYTLAVDARSSWLTNTFDVMIYYDNDGERVPIGTTTWDFEGISEPMIEITVSVNADDVPDAIGKMIGVGFNNTTEDSSWAEVDNVRLTREAVATASEDRFDGPNSFVLGQNYPNPFNPETVIPYQLSEAGRVQLEVYDLLGHKVTTLIDASQTAGSHHVRWDGYSSAGLRVPSGMYIYRIVVEGSSAERMSTASRSMFLLK